MADMARSDHGHLKMFYDKSDGHYKVSLQKQSNLSNNRKSLEAAVERAKLSLRAEEEEVKTLEQKHASLVESNRSLKQQHAHMSDRHSLEKGWYDLCKSRGGSPTNKS